MTDLHEMKARIDAELQEARLSVQLVSVREIMTTDPDPDNEDIFYSGVKGLGLEMENDGRYNFRLPDWASEDWGT